MVLINLIGNRGAQKIKNARTHALFFILLLAAFALALAWHNFSLGSGVDKIRISVAKDKKTLDRLLSIKKETDAIKKKESAIADLVKLRKWPVNLLDAVAASVPEKRLWLVSVDANDDIVAIRGESLASGEVAVFMDRLERTNLFAKVNLKALKQKKITGKKIKIAVFEIVCGRDIAPERK